MRSKFGGPTAGNLGAAGGRYSQVNHTTFTKNKVEFFLLIHGKKTARKCPKCGNKGDWRYFQTTIEGKPRTRDLVAWGCKQCGTVFNRWEVNWDDVS